MGNPAIADIGFAKYSQLNAVASHYLIFSITLMIELLIGPF